MNMKKISKNMSLVIKLIGIISALLIILFIFKLKAPINEIAQVEQKEILAEEEHEVTLPEGYIGITTVEELKNISNGLTGNYILMADIDMTGQEWTPIGTYSTPFKGILDGNNYTISNLNIESSEEYVGMFGYINNGTVKNLKLESINVNATETTKYLRVGVLSGYANSSIVEDIIIIGNNKVTTALSKQPTYIGGLIGETGMDGTYQNIEINNIEVIGNTSSAISLGGLIGYSKSTVNNSVVKGNSIIKSTECSNTSDRDIGGLIGYQYQNSVTNSYTDVEIIVKEGTTSVYVGGLIGSFKSYNKNLKVSNSYSNSTIAITTNYGSDVGGLIGRSIGHNKNSVTSYIDVEKVYTTGKIIVEGTANNSIGGLIGYSYNTRINNAYSTVSIEGENKNDNSSIGALIGKTYNFVSIQYTYAVGKITENITTEKVGGIVGDGTNCSISYSYWSPETTGINKNGITSGEKKLFTSMLYKNNYNNWNFDEIWQIEEGETLPYLIDLERTENINKDGYVYYGKDCEGDGTEDNPWIINNIEEFQQIGLNKGATEYIQEVYENIYFELGDNLNFEQVDNIVPIVFSGVLDGKNYSINNITVKSAEEYVGVFKENKGTIKNIIVNNLNIESNYNGDIGYIGGICGNNEGTISKIEVNGILNNKGTVTNLNIGQITGNNKGTINGVEVSGTLNNSGTVTNLYTGKVAGCNEGTINKAEVKGTIKNNGAVTNLYIGQIAGCNKGTICRTHANGTLINVGEVTNGYIGGITGINSYKIQMSYNIGNSNISNILILNQGGIAGQSGGKISNAYSKENSKINVKSAVVGGIAGKNSGIIQNTYSTNSLEENIETLNIGGIAGDNTGSSSIISSYYNNNNVEEIVGRGTLVTLDELMKQETFENWNFDKIWYIEENKDTPIFNKETYNSEEDIKDLQDEEYYEDVFWEWHTRTTTDDMAYNGKHIIINPGESIDFYGYGVTSYKDYLYKSYSDVGNKIFMFKIDETQASYHTLDGAGFIFNAKKENDLISGYILLIKEASICIYRLDNVNATTFETASSSTIETYGTLIESVTKKYSTTHNLIIKTSPTNVNVIDNGEETLNVALDYEKHAGEDFGLIASYAQHACSILTKISFLEFEMVVQDYTIPIIKVDENGNRLEGAKFQVKDENSEIVREGTTNSRGIFNITGLQEGIYTLEEVKVPDKCAEQEYSYTFKITNEGKVVDIETEEEVQIKVVNQKLKFTVTVKDTNEKAIKDAKVKLYDENGNEILNSKGEPIVGTTDVNGNIIFTEINSGSYIFKQIETPENYIIYEKEYGVSIEKDGTISFTDGGTGIIYNEIAKIDITAHKVWVDTQEQKVHRPAKIKIQVLNGNVVVKEQEIETSSDIDFTFSDLPKYDENGNEITYTLKEVEVNEGDLKYYVSGINADTYTVTNTFTVPKDTIKITAHKVWVDTQEQKVHRPAKIKIQVLNGNVVVKEQEIETSSDIDFTFSDLPKYDENGNEITYTLKEVEVNEGDLKYYVSGINADTYTITNTFTVPTDTVSVDIKKVYKGTNIVLKGATIAVINEEGVQKTSITNENGYATFSGLKLGKTYTYKEIKAPTGYVLNDTEYSFKVEIDGTITDIKGNRIIENEKIRANATIKKYITGTTSSLTGAEIGIYDENGNIVTINGVQMKGLTGEDGTIIFMGLEPGIYFYKEIKAPNGYELNTNSYKFTVNEEGKITFENSTGGILYNDIKLESVTIKKIDAITKFGLKGATITVIDEDGVKKTAVTNEDGYATFTGLKVGKIYTYKETIAPTGYILNSTEYSFKIELDGTITDIIGNRIIENYQGQLEEKDTVAIEIIKVDAETKLALEGSTIGIYDEQGNALLDENGKHITGITNKEGKITFAVPKEEKTYIYKELEAPKGYKLNDTQYSFKVDKDGNIVDLIGNRIIQNYIILGKIEIYKVEYGTEKYLPNTTIAIYNYEEYNSGNLEPLQQLITTENGKVMFENLKIGKYIVKETKAPEGYNLDSNILVFEISNKGEIVILEGSTKFEDTIMEDIEPIIPEEPDNAIPEIPNNTIKPEIPKDNTVAGGMIPQTGKKIIAPIITISIASGFAIYFYKKIKYLN